MTLKLLVAVALGLLCANCATVTRGTTNNVQIVSEPAEADARLSTGQSCTTPCTVTVPRSQEFTVVVSKPGFLPQQVEVKTQVAGGGAAGLAGNILLGGVVGLAADAASGASLDHVPNPVRVTLEPERPAAARAPRGLRPRARGTPTAALPPLAPDVNATEAGPSPAT